MTNIDFKPVDQTTWPDLEALFESRGGPAYCYCMVWRNMAPEKYRNLKSDRKSSLKHHVETGKPVGLLAYDHGVPIGWCSVAPRDTFRKLGGEDHLEKVWSLTCFFVKRPYRRQGLMKSMIQAARQYAHASGAKYLEAYPVAPDSPSYRFMGFVPLFERLSFKYVKPAGSRRQVMRLKLE
ncbi:MAG: GNAT family N-acetyltransferase [Saprospiraceae bacterium]